MWPFHTWLPDAHTEAPTVGSVLLAGVMLKMGTYGFIRIALPILPDGAREATRRGSACSRRSRSSTRRWRCLAQKDLKRLIAFSSVGHMGFVMLGIATLTTRHQGRDLRHGRARRYHGDALLPAGSIHDRYHTREIALIGGGMAQKMPLLAGIFAFTAIASLGLPGLAGFWGEVMSLLASFNPPPAFDRAVPLVHDRGGVGTILTAGYFLWMLQRVNMGTLPDKWKETGFRDLCRQPRSRRDQGFAGS